MAALATQAVPMRPALAHVTLDRAELPADSYVRVAVRVPHGCDGAPMTGLRVEIPPALRSVKPAPKPGWTLTVVPGEPEHATHAAAGGHGHGHGHDRPVKEIAWQGGNLPDAFYDEFILFFRTPDQPGATLYFATIQSCEGGKEARWTQRPTTPGERLERPAYPVRIVPKN
jgi:uncharacterized protein YcnI